MMKIDKECVVSLIYDLEVDNEIIQSVKEEQHLEFIYGTGYLLPKFEDHIFHKVAGDHYDFSLSAGDAYGEDDPQAYIELSKDLFKVDGKIKEGLLHIGNILPMQDSDGNKLNGSIEDVREETIVMNFNHPLAGCDLHFTGTILSVRKATPQELANGLQKEAQGCSPSACSSCSGCS